MNRPLRVALLGDPTLDLMEWTRTLAGALTQQGVAVQVGDAPAPAATQVRLCPHSALQRALHAPAETADWAALAHAHTQQHDLTLWHASPAPARAAGAYTLRLQGVPYCSVGSHAQDATSQALAAMAPLARQRGWQIEAGRPVPAPRWQGVCERCADPQCERALFRRLLG